MHTSERHSESSLSIVDALILAHPADLPEVYDDKLWRDRAKDGLYAKTLRLRAHPSGEIGLGSGGGSGMAR